MRDVANGSFIDSSLAAAVSVNAPARTYGKDLHAWSVESSIERALEYRSDLGSDGPVEILIRHATLPMIGYSNTQKATLVTSGHRTSTELRLWSVTTYFPALTGTFHVFLATRKTTLVGRNLVSDLSNPTLELSVRFVGSVPSRLGATKLVTPAFSLSIVLREMACS